jgi:hypothetical protein
VRKFEMISTIGFTSCVMGYVTLPLASWYPDTTKKHRGD